MIGSIVIFSFLYGLALAGSSANQYIDNALQANLPQALRAVGLDPAAISDFRLTFGVQGVYNNQGEAVFSRGNINNLNRIARKGDCTGPRNVGGEITVNCTLALKQMVTEYKVIIRNNTEVYYPRNMGHVSESLISVVIAGYPQNYIGSVKSLRVDRVGQITPTFSGIPGPLNRYLQVLQNGYRSHVSNQIYMMLQQQYPNALNVALSGVHMPRQ